MPSWSKTIQDIYKLIYAEESRRLDTVEIPLESDLAETPKMKIDGRMPLVEIYYRLKRRPDIEGIIDSCRSIYSNHSNQGILVE